MEQLVLIVVIALISLVNWVMKRSAEIRETRRQERRHQGIPESDPYRAGREVVASPASFPADVPAEMRKLMEALGLPMEEAALPEPVFEESLPPPPLPPSVKAAVGTPRASPRSQTPIPPASPTTPVPPLIAALHMPDSLRRAIILREILGPPKALAGSISS